jgi:hypothetical protein
MKMVKRTLIAIALVAFLASTAPAYEPVIQGNYQIYYWGAIDKDTGVKVEGNEKVYWPYEYKALDICSMPVKMEIGMYVEVQDCTDKKIVMHQVDCGEIGKGTGDFPCYLGCTKFSARANFDVKLGTRLVKDGPVMNKWEAFYNGDDVIAGDGGNHEVEVCVKAWLANLWNGTPGDEVTVGTLYITAKPDV